MRSLTLKIIIVNVFSISCNTISLSSNCTLSNDSSYKALPLPVYNQKTIDEVMNHLVTGFGALQPYPKLVYDQMTIEKPQYLSNSDLSIEETSEGGFFVSNVIISSEEEAKRIARYAGAAYCTDNTLNAWSCSHCKILVPGIKIVSLFNNEKSGGRGFIAIDEKRNQIILSFRGSSNFMNWVTNIKFFKTQLKVKGEKDGIYVHSGFKEALDQLSPYYLPTLKNLVQSYPDHTIVATGHSLGGALAVLSIIDLNEQLSIPYTQIQLFTYGSPRVGNEAFAKFLNKQYMTSTRVVYRRDIVPHLPSGLFGYVHYQAELYVTENGSYVCHRNENEDPKGANSNYFLTISDHLTYWDVRLGGVC